MHRLALILVVLCVFANSTPARALETLKFCDNIVAPAERMTCLQAHISNLEETLLTLSERIITLEKLLDAKLGADGVYKLQHVGRGACLIVGSGDVAPKLSSCDEPDSWKLLSGSQRAGRAKVRSKSDDDEDETTDKKDKKKKNKNKDKKPDDSSQPDAAKAKQSDTSEQTKTKSAPAQ
jgi:hypothetical protein